MPFIGHISLICSYMTKIILFWFLFPLTQRKNNEFRSKLVGYMCLFPMFLILAQVYTHMSSLFLIIPLKTQWCLGFLLPVMKKLNLWIATKIAFKAAGGSTTPAKVAMICGVGGMHSFMLTLLLASKVTQTTAYLVMILDSLPNILSCAKIVKRHYRVADVINWEANEAVLCWTLKEFLELLIPCVYCASFLIAYYGPNAEILGNVKNDYWQFERVDNVFEKLKAVGIFFGFDVVRAILCGLILWFLCKINVCKTYCYIMYTYGMLILFYIMAALNVVFICYSLIS